MALIQDVLLDYTVSDLQTISVTDATSFTSPDSIADINGIRLMFSTVNSVAEVASADTCLQWFEYIITSGTAVANGISYVVGDVMLFANDITPSGVFTMESTGRYSQYISDSLPFSGLSYTFTPDMTGREAFDSIYFADEIFTIDYYQYTTVYIEGQTLSAGTFLCVGTEGESVLIGGTKRVYVGEVFESEGSETFTGNPKLILYNNYEQYSFSTQYQSFNVYQRYLAAMSESNLPNEPLQANLLQVAGLYASPTIAAETDSGISLTQLQLNLDQINNYYSQQLN